MMTYSAVCMATSLVVACAPVPPERPKPRPVECKIVIIDETASPFSRKYAVIELKNNTPKTIEIHSNLGLGLRTCFDIEVSNAKKERISTPLYDVMISSPFGTYEKVAAIEPGKTVKLPLLPFRPVPRDKLQEGKYQCKARFYYNEYKAESKTISIPLSKEQIEKMDRVMP